MKEFEVAMTTENASYLWNDACSRGEEHSVLGGAALVLGVPTAILDHCRDAGRGIQGSLGPLTANERE